MNTEWKECNTLATQGSFKWKRCDGIVYIQAEGGSVKLNDICLNTIVDYINNRNEGTQLGARNNGTVSPESVGAYMQNKYGNNFQRKNCSYLAAILVSEGLIDFEYLGMGSGKGIWLYPCSNEGSNDSGIFQDAIKVENNQDVGVIFKQLEAGLIKLAGKVRETEISESMTWDLRFNDISLDSVNNLTNEIKNWEKNNDGSLYIYKILVNNKADVNCIYEEYLKSKGINTDRLAYARVNKEHRGNPILYVGSSKSVGQRLKGHLGFGYKRTFSLQMSSWSKGLAGGINIEILRFNSETSQSVIQVIEDGLWSVFKPMFGRQGKK